MGGRSWRMSAVTASPARPLRPKSRCRHFPPGPVHDFALNFSDLGDSSLRSLLLSYEEAKNPVVMDQDHGSRNSLSNTCGRQWVSFFEEQKSSRGKRVVRCHRSRDPKLCAASIVQQDVNWRVQHAGGGECKDQREGGHDVWFPVLALQFELLLCVVPVVRLNAGRAAVHERDERGEHGADQGAEKSLFRAEATAGLMSFDLIQCQDIGTSPILKRAHQSQAGQQIAHYDWGFADFADGFAADGTRLLLFEPGHDAVPAKSMTTGCYHSFAEDGVADGARQLFLQKNRQVREAIRVETHLLNDRLRVVTYDKPLIRWRAEQRPDCWLVPWSVIWWSVCRWAANVLLSRRVAPVRRASRASRPWSFMQLIDRVFSLFCNKSFKLF